MYYLLLGYPKIAGVGVVVGFQGREDFEGHLLKSKNLPYSLAKLRDLLAPLKKQWYTRCTKQSSYMSPKQSQLWIWIKKAFFPRILRKLVIEQRALFPIVLSGFPIPNSR